MDPSDATRDQLRTLLLGMESVWLEVECARYEFFFDVIRESNPDVALISLDADQAKALQLIAQLNNDKPDLAILAVSAKNDGQAILQALRNGAREFLTAPVQKATGRDATTKKIINCMTTTEGQVKTASTFATIPDTAMLRRSPSVSLRLLKRNDCSSR